MYTTAGNYLNQSTKEYHTDVITKKHDPNIWGPHFWFALHTSAAQYPESPTLRVQGLMKQRIQAIPYELPCNVCKIHSQSYIQYRLNDLDDVVSTRSSLFNFYVDLHNNANKTTGKRILSYDEALSIWNYTH